MRENGMKNVSKKAQRRTSLITSVETQVENRWKNVTTGCQDGLDSAQGRAKQASKEPKHSVIAAVGALYRMLLAQERFLWIIEYSISSSRSHPGTVWVHGVICIAIGTTYENWVKAKEVVIKLPEETTELSSKKLIWLRYHILKNIYPVERYNPSKNKNKATKKLKEPTVFKLEIPWNSKKVSYSIYQNSWKIYRRKWITKSLIKEDIIRRDDTQEEFWKIETWNRRNRKKG